jgi:hypothetical protein
MSSRIEILNLSVECFDGDTWYFFYPLDKVNIIKQC